MSVSALFEAIAVESFGGSRMTSTMQYRQAMVDNCSWAVSDKARWNYAEVRPTTFLRIIPNG